MPGLWVSTRYRTTVARAPFRREARSQQQERKLLEQQAKLNERSFGQSARLMRVRARLSVFVKRCTAHVWLYHAPTIENRPGESPEVFE